MAAYLHSQRAVMDNRDICSQPPWPEDFEVALEAQQEALEKNPSARGRWRPRLLLAIKVLAIIGFLFVWFTLALPSGKF